MWNKVFLEIEKSIAIMLQKNLMNIIGFIFKIESNVPFLTQFNPRTLKV